MTEDALAALAAALAEVVESLELQMAALKIMEAEDE